VNTIHKIYVERVQPAALAVKRNVTRNNILTVALLAMLFVALIPRAQSTSGRRFPAPARRRSSNGRPGSSRTRSRSTSRS